MERNNNETNDNQRDTSTTTRGPEFESQEEDSKRRRDIEDFDVEDFFSRSRAGRMRRKRNLFSAPEFVQRLNAFEEARAGSTVVFECKWKGCPKPSVKWYKDDEEITENPRYRVIEETDGVLKLAIDCACKQDEGAYKVKAENSEGVSSSTGYLSVTGDIPERSLAAQPRKNVDHSVSFPPHLRTIVEQKSLEEREAEELSTLPPSPLQDYITSVRRGQAGPLFPGCTVNAYNYDAGDSEDSDSDTSVESQGFEEELFIAEEGDVRPGNDVTTINNARLNDVINQDDVQEPGVDVMTVAHDMLVRKAVNSQSNAPGDDEATERYIMSQGDTIKSHYCEGDSHTNTNPCVLSDQLQEQNEKTFGISSGHTSGITEPEATPILSSTDPILSHTGWSPADSAVLESFTSAFNPNPDATEDDNIDHKLAEDFEEFMKSKRKKLDVMVDQSLRESSEDEIAPDSGSVESLSISAADSRLPDVIQNASPSSEKQHTAESELPKCSAESQPQVQSDVTQNPACGKRTEAAPNTDLSTCVTLKSCKQNVRPSSDKFTCSDLPWLDYLGLASVLSFFASCTNMSPFYYILLWITISFVSFSLCVKEERKELIFH